MGESALADREVMGFVHRRPTPRVHHPLLVWHLALWNPIIPSADVDGGQVEALHKARGARARAYAGRLAARIQRGLREIDDPDAGINTFHERYDSDGPQVYEFSLGAFLATVRIELGSEYMTITTLLDMSAPTGNECWHRCPPAVKEVVKGLHAFQSAIDAGADWVRNLAPADLSRLATACFNDIWDAFGRDMLEVGTPAFDALGKRFADFRSVFLGDEIDRAGEPSAAHAHSIAAGLIGASATSARAPPQSEAAVGIQMPYWHVEESYRRDHLRDLKSNHWRDRFHILWPLMTAPVQGDSLVDQEFTATIFDGSALHITAMGAQPAGMPEGAPPRLYYGVYTSGMGGWAIGRLVNSLCELGTLRLAATWEIDELRAASNPLREAEIALQQAFDKDLANGDEAGAVAETDKIPDMAATEPLQQALKRAHQQKEIADGEVKSGGVANRVERSIFYMRRFREVLESFHIEAHDDFQSYDKYVNAHLGSAFLYIERLHARYSRLMLDMRSLYQRMVAEEGRNRYREIERIQKFAEFVSISVLAPYYIGSLFSHMLWMPGTAMTQLWWVVTFTAAQSLAIYFLMRSERNVLAQLILQLLSWMLIAAAAMLAWYGFTISPLFDKIPLHIDARWGWPFISATTAALIVATRSKAMRRWPLVCYGAALLFTMVAGAAWYRPAEVFKPGTHAQGAPAQQRQVWSDDQ